MRTREQWYIVDKNTAVSYDMTFVKILSLYIYRRSLFEYNVRDGGCLVS